MMTNKERAIEISNEFIEDSFKHGCYLGAMKMADWKDHQFKEYLEKKCKEYGNRSQKWFTIDNMWARHRMVLAKYAQSIINEIINELFK